MERGKLSSYEKAKLTVWVLLCLSLASVGNAVVYFSGEPKLAAYAISMGNEDPHQSPYYGEVVYRPDHTVNPFSSAGYPRLIRLEQSGAQYNDRLLATFARFGHGQPEDIPVYQSLDNGKTWTHISTVTASTQSGWGIGGPTIFEIPQQTGNLAPGTLLVAGTAWKHDGPPNKDGTPGLPGTDNDFSHQVIEVHQSTDHGLTWSHLSNCLEINNKPNEFGYGIWEPHFVIDSSGNLVCYFAWERPDADPNKAQVLAHVVSTNGGQSWGSVVFDVASSDNAHRPGMPIVKVLPNGNYIMAYELCVGGMNANDACLVYVKQSSDGISWSPSSLGTLVETSEGHRLAHTPYIAWSPAGGENGALIMYGQVLVSGNTGNLNELEASGKTLFLNTNLGNGYWFEMPAPFAIGPVGNYNPEFPAPQIGCAGYSSALLPSKTGTSLSYIAGVLMSADGAHCEIRFGEASLHSLPYYASLAGGTDAGWTTYGGQWLVKDETYSITDIGPGYKTVTGSTGWDDYTFQSDMKLLSEGQSGLIFRVTNPGSGADVLNGYYLGLETNYSGSQPAGSMVLGKFINNSWTELGRTSLPGGVLVHRWYHLTIQAVGCALTASAQLAGDTNSPTSFSYTDASSCRTAGQIGLRSHFTRAAWRNISVVAGGTTTTNTLPYYAPFAQSSTGWTSYGGSWSVTTDQEIYQNQSGGLGEKSVAGNTAWTNYTMQGDVKLTTGTGSDPNAGFLVRVTTPAVGVDSLNGYYLGINSASDALVLGRHNYNWTFLSSAQFNSDITTDTWYHAFLQVSGCNIKISVQAIDSPDQTRFSYSDCTLSAGQIGLRTFNTQAIWRYIAMSPK